MQEDTAGKGPELVLERDGVPIVMPCFVARPLRGTTKAA